MGIDAEILIRLKQAEKPTDEQVAQRAKLESNLRATACSVTTREALVKLLPEFEKYLPAADAPQDRTVPALANLVADFVAAGWPKGKEPAAV